MRRHRDWLLLILLASVAAAGGCDRGPQLPPMQKVSGTVKIDGAPLTRGSVQFQPDTSQGASGPPAVGTIDANGRYQLETAQVKGAVVGKHTVTVEARAEPRDHTDTLPMSLIPEKYNAHATSGIVKDVTADGANTHDIDLSSK